VADRAALRLKPDYAQAHCNLGSALRLQGQFAESLAAYRRGHELGRRQPGWNYPSELWLRQAERLAALDQRLPALLQGDAQPRDAAEQVELAQLCALKRWHAASARFSAAAFAAQPALADDLNNQLRYRAAHCATLAGCGQGEDDPKPDAPERARLRRQARDRLATDLNALTALVERKNPQTTAAVAQRLRHWQQNAALTEVRHPWALWGLPADERKDWQQLWADVDGLLQKADAGK
jgi:hypothetical protein